MLQLHIHQHSNYNNKLKDESEESKVEQRLFKVLYKGCQKYTKKTKEKLFKNEWFSVIWLLNRKQIHDKF